MASINTGSGSAHGGLGGAYQDGSGWETPEETSLPETPASEDKTQAILQLEQQVQEAKGKNSAKMAERAERESRLEENFGVAGCLAGAIACPWLMMSCFHAEGREILAGYIGIPAGGIAGGYAGKYLGKFINYLRRAGSSNQVAISSATPKKPYQRDDSDRDDKEDDNRTFPGTGYPG